jgi:site-specific recombinase XerD
VRANCGHNGGRPLFCTSSGERVSNAYIRRLLPVLGRRASIDKRVHAHGLRHTHAAQLREEGLDIGVISKQLGHSAISTTATYLDHIAPWRVIDLVSARNW